MSGENVTAIILALIGLAGLGMTSYVTLRVTRRIEPKIDSIDRAVNTVPDSAATIRELTKSAGEGVERLEAQGRVDRGEVAAGPDRRADEAERDAREDLM